MTLIASNIINNSGDAIVISTGSDIIDIAPGVLVYSASGFGITLSGLFKETIGTIDVQGYVGSRVGIGLVYDTGGEYINIGKTGSVVGSWAGLSLWAKLATASPKPINNSGYIYGSYTGVRLDGPTATITNSGFIGGDTAINVYSTSGDVLVNSVSGVIMGNSDAIVATGTSQSLVNAGAISATSATGHVVEFGGSSSVSNSGTIEGVQKGVTFDGGGDTLQNSGTIAVTGSDAVLIAGDNLSLVNSGRISASANTIHLQDSASASNTIVNQVGGAIAAASGYAILETAGRTNLTNRGDLTGNVALTGGSIYLNGGNATGNVSLGDASTFVNTGKASGVVRVGGAGATVRNRGTLTDDDPFAGVAAIYVVGSSASVAYDRVVNGAKGVIDATGMTAIGHGPSGTLILANRGEILGNVVLSGQSTVNNTGSIVGGVVLAGGAATVTNRGLIDGAISFVGTGNTYNGQTGAVTGAIYGAGPDGRYYGGDGAETFNMTFDGASTVSGGGGDDTFVFAPAGLTSATTLIGGDGNDTLTFSAAGAIGSGAFALVSGIETINLANGVNSLTLTDALVGSAINRALTVNGGTGADTINASRVTTASDTVTIDGGGGGDTITAGGGKEVFAYGAVADSTGAAYDRIAGVNFDVDQFSVSAAAGSILAINPAVTVGSLSAASFNADLAAALPAGTLGAHDALLFTASGGGLMGATFLVVDANGVAGYQANHDLVIRLTGATGTLTTADFV